MALSDTQVRAAKPADKQYKRTDGEGIRRDGHQPIIFMQCGPIRYKASNPASTLHELEVVPLIRQTQIDFPVPTSIQDIFRQLASDQARTESIAAEIQTSFKQGRKVLVLTERTEHLDAIKKAIDNLAPSLFVLHGRMPRKQRSALLAELKALPHDAPHVVLATGKLVGEGFDHPPVSNSRVLIQLHRQTNAAVRTVS